MDTAALGIALYGLFDQLARVGLTIHTGLKTAKHFANDAESLRIHVADEVQRIRQMRSLLLTPNKILPHASLFESLPQDDRQNLAMLLYHVAGPIMGEFGDLWSRYLAHPPEIRGVEQQFENDERSLDQLITEFENLQSEDHSRTELKLRDKIRWAFSDKDKAKSLVSELADSTRRIKDDIELFCFPLGILKNNAGALRDDPDAIGSGWAEDSELIKLLADKSAIAHTEGNINTQQLAVPEGLQDQQPEATVLMYYQSEPALVQFRSYKADDDMDAPQAVMDNMRLLAALFRQLNQIDQMKFRILKFLGFYQEMRRQRFGLVFAIPKRVSSPEPICLKQLLTTNCPFSLDQRFKHAQTLATTLSRLHRVSWVHKNMRSENILYFKSQDDEAGLSGPWIIGLTHARRDDGDTSMVVDANFERNIYRHPQRWSDPLRYRQMHDIYSLGVVLLEIGTWSPVLQSLSSNVRSAGEQIQRGLPSLQLRNKVAAQIRESGKRELPSEMGSMYTQVVLTCLNLDFDIPADEAQEAGLQRAFWQHVVEKLRLASEALR